MQWRFFFTHPFIHLNTELSICCQYLSKLNVCMMYDVWRKYDLQIVNNLSNGLPWTDQIMVFSWPHFRPGMFINFFQFQFQISELPSKRRFMSIVDVWCMMYDVWRKYDLKIVDSLSNGLPWTDQIMAFSWQHFGSGMFINFLSISISAYQFSELPS